MVAKKKIIKINEDVCIGCGSCADTSPEHFHLVDGISKVKKQYDEADKEDIEAAVKGCPVQAISIEEEQNG